MGDNKSKDAGKYLHQQTKSQKLMDAMRKFNNELIEDSKILQKEQDNLSEKVKGQKLIGEIKKLKLKINDLTKSLNSERKIREKLEKDKDKLNNKNMQQIQDLMDKHKTEIIRINDENNAE